MSRDQSGRKREAAGVSVSGHAILNLLPIILLPATLVLLLCFSINLELGRWYVLETNYDHWKEPLFLDDRRTPATKCMNQTTQSVSSVLNFLFRARQSRTLPVLTRL